MNKPSKEEAMRLIKAGYGTVLRNQAVGCTSPIFWSDMNKDSGSRIAANGTMFFMRFTDKLIGITAAHVYQGYVDASIANPNLRCILYDTEFNITERIIDHSTELDIATFELSEEELQQMGGRFPHEPYQDWPPSTLQEGRGVVFAGYPGVYREEEDWNVSWSPYSALAITSVVAEDRIMVQFEREFMVPEDGKALPSSNLWLGGMSGGPLFGLWESPVLYINIAGVVVDFNENLEIARFCPINHIRQDGTIAQ